MDNITMKEEDTEEAVIEPKTPVPLPPSFRGKLNLKSFTHTPKIKLESKSPIRNSPRLSQLAPATSSPIPSMKRKPSTSSLNLTPSPSPKKKSRSPSGYAPPSTYAHLPPLRDVLAPNLICIFIGLNPGIETARSGHAYAHPSNLFWKLMYSSGCTTRLCKPEEDGDLPRLFELGNTNIVERPTRNGSELSKGEMDGSVKVLEEKIARYRPEAVAIVGKSIWESLWRVRRGRKMGKEEFRYGWQDEGERMGAGKGEGDGWKGARVFVACSTSGLAAGLSREEKARIWRELGVWVEKRREERAGALVARSP